MEDQTAFEFIFKNGKYEEVTKRHVHSHYFCEIHHVSVFQSMK